MKNRFHRSALKGIPWLMAVFLCCCINSANGQDRSFRIVTFTLNGEPVKDFAIAFELNGKTVFPHRVDNTIFVPTEIAKAENVAMVFDISGFHFSFPSGQLGYVESDDLKVDMAVEIDTPPFDPKWVEKKWGGKKLRKICAIYSLTGVPQFTPGPSYRIVDPITTSILTRCP